LKRQWPQEAHHKYLIGAVNFGVIFQLSFVGLTYIVAAITMFNFGTFNITVYNAIQAAVTAGV